MILKLQNLQTMYNNPILRERLDGMDEFEFREQPNRKRLRYGENNTYQHEDTDRQVDVLQRKIASLERTVEQERHNSAIAERKRRQTLRAYFTLVHDARYQATSLRKWMDSKIQCEEDGELEDCASDILNDVQERVHKIISLGHCPLSGEPLGERTYINTCGHIFDKAALASKSLELCPECSHKMIYPRGF